MLNVKRLYATLVAAVLSAAAYPLNVVQQENALPGNWDWVLTKPAHNDEIQAYATSTSVNRGGTITFCVNSPSDTQVTVAFYRVGWYNGVGGRLMGGPVTLFNAPQTKPPISDPVTLMLDQNWSPFYTLSIGNSASPTDWPSGIYLAKFTGTTTGLQCFATFAVRDDQRASALLFQQSVLTYAAYNNNGGLSLYWNANGQRCHAVSFNRPYERCYGAGDFLDWEIQMLRFLEKNGYDVSYATDIDTHLGTDLVAAHKAMLIVGHDEYVTQQQRANITAARDKGIHLGYFGAGNDQWQIRLENDAAGNPNRSVIAWKEQWTDDPYYALAQLSPVLVPYYYSQISGEYRFDPLNNPECSLVGVQWHGNPVNTDIVISNAAHWVCAGAGLKNGSHLPGLLGYEADAVSTGTPANIQIIATSPDPWGNANMTIYQAPSKAWVFAAGSMQFNWGLDSFPAMWIGQAANSVVPAAQTIAKNVLNQFIK